MAIVTLASGALVAPMSAHTARTLWDVAIRGPRDQCVNVKTFDAWRAIRHQVGIVAHVHPLTVAKAWARMEARRGNPPFAYVLHATDKVTRVCIDAEGKARLSSAMPYRPTA